MQYPINDSYESALIALVRDMRLSAAQKKINEFTEDLLELGYSKQELAECIKAYLKEE